MSRSANINKHVPISEIIKVKRDLQQFVELYDKVTFIEEVYRGVPVKTAIEKKGKTAQTGYKWLKEWNDNGFDGLFRKEGSGRNSKLSDSQFEILRRNIHSKDLSSVSEVQSEIQNEFGVVYSKRHLRRLISELNLFDVSEYDDK